MILKNHIIYETNLTCHYKNDAKTKGKKYFFKNLVKINVKGSI